MQFLLGKKPLKYFLAGIKILYLVYWSALVVPMQSRSKLETYVPRKQRSIGKFLQIPKNYSTFKFFLQRTHREIFAGEQILVIDETWFLHYFYAIFTSFGVPQKWVIWEHFSQKTTVDFDFSNLELGNSASWRKHFWDKLVKNFQKQKRAHVHYFELSTTTKKCG